MWQQWVNGIIGVWMIILSFISINVDNLRAWVLWLGIVVAILGFWGAVYYNQKRKA